VDSATDIALTLGVNEIVVGLTVVALGTSLPELATSMVATARGQRDLAVGNVVGSNIANLGLVLGLSALVAAGGIPVPDSVLSFDLPFMVAVAVAALPIALTGFVIARWEGAFFVGYLIAYVLYLWLDASGRERVETYTAVVFGFVLPLIIGTVILVAVFEWRSRRRTAV
jgi:cation:H+ antiporter